MEFRILGPLEVVEDGRTVRLGGPRQRALLALLLLHANETVSADRLVDELWEETPPRSGSSALHNQIARLRRVLGAERIVTRAGGYALELAEDELDLARFRALAALAEGAPAAERSSLLREALALWRGDQLPELTAVSARAAVASLEELRDAALEDRIDADLELGRHAELVGELTAHVARHPLRERPRAQLILALYRSGRQAEALDVYRETRRLLDEELGLQPSPALRELERAILRHDPAVAAAPAATPAAEPPARRRRRSRLVVAAAAAVVAAAAAATVLVLHDRAGATEARSDPPAAPEGAQPASLEPEPAPVEAAVSRPVARKVVQRPQATPRATARTTTTKRTPVPRARRPAVAPRPAVTSPALARAAKPKPTPTPRPARTTPEVVAPEPAAKAETVRVQDDFEDGELDEMVWSPFYTGTGGTLGEQNGRLELTIQADAKGAGPWRMVAAQVGTHCRFPGDFDFRVEYELLVWPEASGANLILAAWGGDAFSTVSRLSGPTFESYTSNIFNRSYQAPRADVQGMLRLRRAAGIVTAFFRQEGEWIVLDRKQMHGTVTAGLQLLATDPQFPHVEVRAAFDNVALEGESPQCPGGTPA